MTHYHDPRLQSFTVLECCNGRWEEITTIDAPSKGAAETEWMQTRPTLPFRIIETKRKPLKRKHHRISRINEW